MNFKQTSAFIGLIASSALGFSVAPAQAFSFQNNTALGTCAGVPLENLGNSGVSTGPTSCSTADGFTLTASATTPTTGGAKLTKKTVNNLTGVGVFNDSSVDDKGSQQEIDFGETLTLGLAQASVLTNLDLAFLFPEGAVQDLVDEVAVITGYLNGSLVSSINVKGTDPVTGFKSLLNPFGTSAVDKVTLTSPKEDGITFKYSDYSIVAATASSTKVPEPATLAGLGLVGGALFASRRRKGNKAC